MTTLWLRSRKDHLSRRRWHYAEKDGYFWLTTCGLFISEHNLHYEQATVPTTPLCKRCARYR